MPSKHVPDWTPGCGRPHPELALILLWAEGKVTLVEKQRKTHDGREYGQPLKVQYPCWNPGEWAFSVARNSQMILDLSDELVSTRKVKVKPPLKAGRLTYYADLQNDVLGLALG